MPNPRATLTFGQSEVASMRRRVSELLAQIDDVNSPENARVYTPERLKERVAELRGQATAVLREAGAKACEYFDTADQQAAQQLAAMPNDQATLTQRLLAQPRVERMLAAVGPAAAAETFSAHGDVEALRLLRQEIPSFVTERVEDRFERDHTIKTLQDSVERGMRPHVSADEAVAIDVRQDLATARGELQSFTEAAVHQVAPQSVSSLNNRLADAYAANAIANA